MPIYPLNIVYFNHSNLQLHETKSSIAKAVDNSMIMHEMTKA